MTALQWIFWHILGLPMALALYAVLALGVVFYDVHIDELFLLINPDDEL